MRDKRWEDIDYPASATFLGIDDGTKKKSQACDRTKLSFSDKDLEDPVFLKNFLFMLEICLGIRVKKTPTPGTETASKSKNKKSPVVVTRSAKGVSV